MDLENITRVSTRQDHFGRWLAYIWNDSILIDILRPYPTEYEALEAVMREYPNLYLSSWREKR